MIMMITSVYIVKSVLNYQVKMFAGLQGSLPYNHFEFS